MKSFRLTIHLILALAGLFVVGGCHTDMWTQPKVHKPLQSSDFFVDGASARLPVPHTVAAGSFTTDDALTKGIENKKLVDVFPFPITKDELARGRERFNIYCSPCHGRLGYGDGMIAKRGFNLRKKPGNYHTERLRKMKVGHFYDVITNGFGAMFSYSSRIQDQKDRWRIVAYIRALQLSQNAPAASAGANMENAPIDTAGVEPVKK
jgi:mono/diheme cytochrome c family protein